MLFTALAVIAVIIVVVVVIVRHKSSFPNGTPPQPQPQPPSTAQLEFVNSSPDTITVWLDAPYPPCLEANESRCSWDNNDATFSLYVNNAWTPAKSTRQQVLQKNEAWAITLPVNQKTGLVEWCAGNSCPGAGAWFTKGTSFPMTAPQNVLRAEFNFNNRYDPTKKQQTPQIYYNLSGVDGVNANASMEYISNDASVPCTNALTSCLIDITDPSSAASSSALPCPVSLITTSSGAKACPSPIYLNRCKSPRCAVTSGCTEAGCGSSLEADMCGCRHWWQTNQCAEDWKNFIQKNDKTCNIYAWAYDEFLLKNPSNASCDKDNLYDNPIVPLRQCNMTPQGVLRVTIYNVI